MVDVGRRGRGERFGGEERRGESGTVERKVDEVRACVRKGWSGTIDETGFATRAVFGGVVEFVRRVADVFG